MCVKESGITDLPQSEEEALAAQGAMVIFQSPPESTAAAPHGVLASALVGADGLGTAEDDVGHCMRSGLSLCTPLAGRGQTPHCPPPPTSPARAVIIHTARPHAVSQGLGVPHPDSALRPILDSTPTAARTFISFILVPTAADSLPPTFCVFLAPIPTGCAALATDSSSKRSPAADGFPRLLR